MHIQRLPLPANIILIRHSQYIHLSRLLIGLVCLLLYMQNKMGFVELYRAEAEGPNIVQMCWILDVIGALLLEYRYRKHLYATNTSDYYEPCPTWSISEYTDKKP